MPRLNAVSSTFSSASNGVSGAIIKPGSFTSSSWKKVEDGPSRPALRVLDEGRARLELLDIEAGHLLVAGRNVAQFGGRDHVVDVVEGLAAGALVHFAQDGVRWVLAVAQHHLGGRCDAFLVIGLPRLPGD